MREGSCSKRVFGLITERACTDTDKDGNSKNYVKRGVNLTGEEKMKRFRIGL